ncbi:hypothetical protein ACC674_38260, partial [Rhizobium ruizarguesonis]
WSTTPEASSDGTEKPIPIEPPLGEMRDLPRVVAESTVGKEVDVVVLREGKEQTVKVKLGRLEDSDQAAASEDSAPDGSQDDGVIT